MSSRKDLVGSDHLPRLLFHFGGALNSLLTAGGVPKGLPSTSLLLPSLAHFFSSSLKVAKESPALEFHISPM